MKRITKKTQKEWDNLVSHYTEDYVKNKMIMDEYVLGKGDKTFCYIVERTLSPLGSILGATSKKFGLYYGKNGKDKVKKYRFKNDFGKDENEAFETVKDELSKLIKKAKELKTFEYIESKFNGMYKYKIIYLYNPSIMLPSFYDEDLKYFAKKLGLKPKKTYEDLQKQLMDYKNKYKSGMSNHDFTTELYETFGRPISKKTIKLNDSIDNELNSELKIPKKMPKYISGYSERKKPKSSSDRMMFYPRNPEMAQIALLNAKCQCENNIKHESFIRRKNNTKYTEVHHLVPLCFYNDFKADLDKPENIVSLCSNCHNEIHYGKDADKIIENLYNQRKDKLKNIGVNITLDELLKKYHEIYKKRG